jgi:hypothetical protein
MIEECYEFQNGFLDLNSQKELYAMICGIREMRFYMARGGKLTFQPDKLSEWELKRMISKMLKSEDCEMWRTEKNKLQKLTISAIHNSNFSDMGILTAISEL